MKRPLLFAAISLVAVLLLAGCGGSPAVEEGASTLQSTEEGRSTLQATETNGETNDLGETKDLWGSLATDDEKSTDVHKRPQRSTETATVYFTSDISA